MIKKLFFAIGILGFLWAAWQVQAHYNKPKVEVELFNNYPGSYTDMTGHKVIDYISSESVPLEKLKHRFKYFLFAEDADFFRAVAYKREFPMDLIISSKGKIYVFSDFRPDWEKCSRPDEGPEERYKIWQECRARAKWLRE